MTMKFTRWNVLKELNKHISIYISLLITIGIFSILYVLVSLLPPYLYKIFVDDVMTKGNISILKYLIPIMGGVFIAGVFVSFIKTYFSTKLASKIKIHIKLKLFKKILMQDIADVSKIDVGDINVRIERDSEVVGGFLQKQVVDLITAIMFFITYIVILFIYSPILTVAVIILIPGFALFCKYIGKLFNKINQSLYERASGNRNFLFETIQKWREIKSCTLEEQQVNHYVDNLKPEQKLNLKWMRLFATNNLVIGMKNGFIQNLLLYFLGGLLIITGHITIGGLLMFINYVSGLSTNVDIVLDCISNFVSNKAALKRVFDILSIRNPSKKEKLLTEPSFNFDSVTFSYNNNTNKIYKNVSFEIPYGMKFLVVGKSGSGKSTLVKLLLHMAIPEAGEIFVNNKPIGEIDERSLLRSIGVIMQDSYFFNLSIKENLNIVAPDATIDDIKFALKYACIDDFVESLPNQYDTIIGERGIKLSGGQRQRLAFARLILYHPQVVIFDESTSSIDRINENMILQNTVEQFKDNTLIVISHKADLNIEFDKTLVVNNGTIDNT